MGNGAPTTVHELHERMEASRTELETLLTEVDPALLTQPGPDGWSVRDHIAHIAAWENSIVALLQGIPRHVGLGVEQQLYETGPEESINEFLVEKAQALSLDQAAERHRDVHRQMLDLLGRLTDSDLQRTYSSFLPDEPGDASGRPIIDWISGNTYEHYDHHGALIAAIANHHRL